jgi:hypothetical protein
MLVHRHPFDDSEASKKMEDVVDARRGDRRDQTTARYKEVLARLSPPVQLVRGHVLQHSEHRDDVEAFAVEGGRRERRLDEPKASPLPTRREERVDAHATRDARPERSEQGAIETPDI